MSSPNNDDWHRLAKYVKARRRELRLNQDELKRTGGPSAATVRNIESALQDSYKPWVLDGLARSLKWTAVSIDEILAGGEPTPIVDRHLSLDDSATATDDLSSEEVDPTEARIRRLEAQVAQAVAEQRQIRAE